MGVPRAIIYVLAGPELEREQLRCLDHVHGCGFDLVAVVVDDETRSSWPSVLAMLHDGGDLVVAPSLDTFPEREPLWFIDFVQDEVTEGLPRPQGSGGEVR